MKENRKFNKVDYSQYEGSYDDRVNKELYLNSENMEVETMRAYLFGYTFTEEYANGIFPDEMSMDYWRDCGEGVCDFSVGLPFVCRERLPEGMWDTRDDDSFEIVDQMLEYYEDEMMAVMDDDYMIDTMQERRILEAIDSTGDGKTPETALCVTDVAMEYEYLERVYPYCFCKVARQSVDEYGIDCLEFEENDMGTDRIYFDIGRRFEVGYPTFR